MDASFRRITHNTSFRPKDDKTQLHEYGRSRRPTSLTVTMECTAPETGVKLVGIGYKYNSRKVLLFVMTKNAGKTIPGSPYIARFTDEFGNVKSRRVERPDCISQYFKCANKIDRHNHLRQGILRLEQYWRTVDPWFCIATTVFGMTVSDCYLGMRFHLQAEPFSSFTIEDFADMLANDLLRNNFSDDRSKHPSDTSSAAFGTHCWALSFCAIERAQCGGGGGGGECVS